MAWEKQPVSVEYDDDDILDRISTADIPAPQYPCGLQFSLSCDDLKKCGAEGGEPGDVMAFQAEAEVTSISKGMEDCRIELEISKFAGPDGKLITLSIPAFISLTDCELNKIDLEPDCEVGDTIRLFGTVRLEREYKTDSFETASLQIIELGHDDASTRARGTRLTG